MTSPKTSFLLNYFTRIVFSNLPMDFMKKKPINHVYKDMQSAIPDISSPRWPPGEPRANQIQTGPCQQSLKPHICPICGTVFSMRQALSGHMRKHKPNRLLPCKLARFSLNSSVSDEDGLELQLGLRLTGHEIKL